MISVACPTCGATEPLPDSVDLTPLDLGTVSEMAIAGAKGQA